MHPRQQCTARGPRLMWDYKPERAANCRSHRAVASNLSSLNLGHVRKSMGQDEEARICWRKAVEAKPELAETYFEPGQ